MTERDDSLPQHTPPVRDLPSADDAQIAWDAVADDYRDVILGPNHPAMIHRNPLVPLVRAADSWADFGCGPGLLAAHTAGPVFGIDQSGEMLRAARERVGAHLTPVQEDYSKPGLDCGFRVPLVVSCNAILPPPPRRDQVTVMLANLARHLTPGGVIAAIFPAFDASEHAARLAGGDHAARHLLDPEHLSFADDGANPQCYHTADSIRREADAAGLAVTWLEKVLYPWSLVRRYGYGHHPTSPEVWDWFAVLAPRA